MQVGNHGEEIDGIQVGRDRGSIQAQVSEPVPGHRHLNYGEESPDFQLAFACKG